MPRNVLKYLTVFSLFIYKIKTTSSHLICNQLLESLLTHLNPKVDVSLSLNLFVSLMSQSSLGTSENNNNNRIYVKLMCMRQLTKLCTVHNLDHTVYPLLAAELVTVKPVQLADTLRLEVLYTKAQCIFHIVRHRPDYYAQELLATISNMMNMCSRLSGDQGVCAILIDTLAVLCESEVVDMVSTWQALQAQFRQEKR